MKGIALTRYPGDIVLEKGDIQLVAEGELLCQTIECVIGTNQGEWWLDEDEGIPFEMLRGKSINTDRLHDEIASALLYVDESLTIDNFETSREGRRLNIRFSATNGTQGAAAQYGFEV